MNDTPTGPSRGEDGIWNEPTRPQDLGPTPSSPKLDAGDAATDIVTNAGTASGLQPSEQATIADRRPATSATASWHGVPKPVEPPRRGRPRLPLVIGAALAVVLSAGTAGYVVGEPGSDAMPASADAPVAGNNTATTATESTTTAVSETRPSEPVSEPEAAPATSSRLPGVLGEPAGLFCRDLDANGYSYAEAVTYWEHHGRPAQMDASGMGIPCSTVYPREEVEARWGAAAFGEPCPDSGALLASYPPEVAAEIRGFGDIECSSGWVYAVMHTWNAESPGVVYRLDDGTIREMAMGTSDWKTGEAVQWCVDELGMPPTAAQRFC